jgi:hypothetical protein
MPRQPRLDTPEDLHPVMGLCIDGLAVSENLPEINNIHKLVRNHRPPLGDYRIVPL